MVIKELSQTDARYFVIKTLADLYDYFGINHPDERTFISQADQLIEDLYIYPSITQDQLSESIKLGRREAQDIIKPSVKNIMQWISNYMIRFRKAESQAIHQSHQPFSDVKYSTDQRKAWVISSFRQYHEGNKDMKKFYDFGAVTYSTIYKFMGYQLTEKQINWCINEAKKAEVSIFGNIFNQQMTGDAIKDNPTASAYACKLFFDQFTNEEEIRSKINFFKNVDKDHYIASMQYTPWALEYKLKGKYNPSQQEENNGEAMKIKEIF